MQFYTPVELREIMLIPLYSDLVECGFPSPAQDYVEQRIDSRAASGVMTSGRRS